MRKNTRLQFLKIKAKSTTGIVFLQHIENNVYICQENQYFLFLNYEYNFMPISFNQFINII